MPEAPELGSVTWVGPVSTSVSGVPGFAAFVRVTFGLVMNTTWLLVPVTVYSAGVPVPAQVSVAGQVRDPLFASDAVPSSWTTIEPKSMSDTFVRVSGLTIVACAWTGPLLTEVGAATADVAVRTVAPSATLKRAL